MAINISSTVKLSNIMTTQLDLEELKLNIDNMFLVINGIIVSCEYIDDLMANIYYINIITLFSETYS